MKKIILLSLLALPVVAGAQRLSFGVQGGMNPKTTDRINSTTANYALSTRLMVGFKHFETGVGFEMGGYAGRAAIHDDKIREAYKTIGKYKVYTSANYYAIYLIGNYKLNLTSKLELYAGIAAGMDIGEAVDRAILFEFEEMIYPPYNIPYRNIEAPSVNKRDHALALGLQSGARYHLNNRIALQGEIAARNIRFLSHFKYSTFYFPVTLGANIRLAGK